MKGKKRRHESETVFAIIIKSKALSKVNLIWKTKNGNLLLKSIVNAVFPSSHAK
ncbi:unnamed protein product [Hymenolepis diminuta]|uniref:Uncharacterized protein n=1 Tax=Hymenolepis diminuta TaxID=6216 RepID=A0A564XYW8_HYMDI|nr:unnamed protein product [Hymenolepis diminuta]